MKTVLEGNKQVKIVDVPIPKAEPGSGMVLAKVLASAVCGSEREIWAREIGPKEAFYNFGHEAIAEIVDANGSERLHNGQRVAVQIHNYCGKCYYCRKGLYIFCTDRHQKAVMCHAQYVLLPDPCFFPIDEDIPPEIAVLLGGDCMGVANRALKQISFEKGEWVFISGAGPVGLGVIFMAKAMGARVVVSDFSEIRRKFATEHAGAEIALDPAVQDVHKELLELTDGLGPFVIIECSGNPTAQAQALEWCRCQGHVVFCGQNYGKLEFEPSNQVIHKEMNIHGARYYVPDDVKDIVKMYREGMNPKDLISDIVSIDEAPALMNDFFIGNTGGKVIILPNGKAD